MLKDEKKVFIKRIDRHKSKVEKMMHTAPFWRLADKLSFVIGVFIIVSYSFVLGRFPNDLCYIYIQMLMPVLLVLRWLHYYHMGWHYYISDFCYFANMLILYYLTFDSKNDQLFKICFLYSQGALAAAIKAFRNSLVFHKIDMLTSLAIHAIPMTIMWHIRWFTIPD